MKLLRIYNSLVRSIIEYDCPVWQITPTENMKKLDATMFFDWILAISITAISSILRSTGSMLPSTSIAYLPDVAGNPKHIDNTSKGISGKQLQFQI
jgi:hypothetical protein